VTFTEEYIDDFERELIEFERKYHTDNTFKALVQNTSKCELFGEAWGWLYEAYPRLMNFCDALSFIFSCRSTVESDFSLIGLEKMNIELV